jgi:hypothetical protein
MPERRAIRQPYGCNRPSLLAGGSLARALLKSRAALLDRRIPMDHRLIVTSLGAGLLLLGCGGGTDATSTTAQDLSGRHGHGSPQSCLDAGPSPCIRGDKDDEDGGDPKENEDADDPAEKDDGGDPSDDGGGQGHGHGHASDGGKH